MLDRWQRASAAATTVGPVTDGGAGAERLDDIPARELGALLVGIEDVPVRDAILVSLAGSGTGPPGAAGSAEGVLTSIFVPGGPRPELSRVRAAQSALLALAALCTRRRAAAPLGMLAWLAWWCGEGARTDVLVGRCLDQDPGHRLARLLRQALDHGLPPGWARPAQPG
jgi:hypothetical protein